MQLSLDNITNSLNIGLAISKDTNKDIEVIMTPELEENLKRIQLSRII